MFFEETHPTDQELLLAADGELSALRAARVAGHLTQCWPCRARKQELEEAVVDFVGLQRGQLDPRLPPAAGPRALLKAQLAELTSASPAKRYWWFPAGSILVALIVVAILATRYGYEAGSHPVPVSFPEPSLTPGAVSTAN